MKKIINGKVYDTETAKEVVSTNNGYFCNDASYVEETLYVKKTGEYFIYGYGGSFSRYGKYVGDSMVYGEKIIPITFDTAQEWAEKHVSADEYEKIFGEIIEDDTNVTTSISLDKNVHETAKRTAQQKSMTVSAYIAALIVEDNKRKILLDKSENV